MVQKVSGLLLSLLIPSLSALAQSCPLVRTHLGDGIGERLAAGADFNGDGYSDYLIAQKDDLAAGIGTRVVKVHSGINGQVLYSIYSPNFPSDFGNGNRTMTTIPDRNTDGVRDILIGDPFDGLSTDQKPGRVFIFSGKTGAFLQQIVGSVIGDEFGDTVSTVPDLTGDGVEDILIGAPRHPGTALGDVTSNGRVYVYSGSTLMLQYFVTPASMQNLFGVDARNVFNFPSDLIGIGDIDGDGRGDFLASDGLYDVQQTIGGETTYYDNAGLVGVYSGATGSLINAITGGEDDLLGFDMGAAGLMDGDSKPEVLIAARDSDSSSGVNEAGRVYVIRGSSLTSVTLQFLHVLEGSQVFQDFGSSVSGGMDMNGDGVPDVVVGARSTDFLPLYPNAGGTFVYSGATGQLLLSFPGPASDSNFGSIARFLGDINGDGSADLAVGCLHQFGSPLPQQGAYIFSLSADSDNDGTLNVCELPPGGGGSFPTPTPTSTPTPPGGGGGGGTNPTISKIKGLISEGLNSLGLADDKLPSATDLKKAKSVPSKYKKLSSESKKITSARKSILAALNEAAALLGSLSPSALVAHPELNSADMAAAQDAALKGLKAKSKHSLAKKHFGALSALLAKLS